MSEYAPLNTKTPSDGISKEIKDEYNTLLNNSSKLNNKTLYNKIVNESNYDNTSNNTNSVSNTLSLLAQNIEKNIFGYLIDE